jgi:hypothetical protein
MLQGLHVATVELHFEGGLLSIPSERPFGDYQPHRITQIEFAHGLY